MDGLLTRAVSKVIPADLAKAKLAGGKKLRVYWGIDPTGGKIHLGHTVPMRKLQAFADAGHEAILLIGSFTGMIGDPSDRDSIRQPLTKEQVEENFKTYKKQAAKVIDFKKVEIRYNHEWLEKLGYKEIIEHASKFTVQQMEERAMFAERMAKDKPVSVHEFLYPLMVGYDSVVLDVDCELGGTDQEFNMLAGRAMQKAFGKREKFILTTPLIEGTDGRKMSKSYENCVYLDDEPSDMFGKVMSIKDDLMATYFECCTDVDLDEVKKIVKGNPREAKARLAREIVTLYHGKDAAEKAENEFASVFTKKGLPNEIPNFGEEVEDILGKKLDEKQISKEKSQMNAYDEKTIGEIMILAGFVSSKSDARRIVEQGGVQLNNKKIDSIDTLPVPGILKVGKRKFTEIRNFSNSHLRYDSGGSLSLEVIPLRKNYSKLMKERAVIEAFPTAIKCMSDKGYIDIPSNFLLDPKSIEEHFTKLFNEELILYHENEYGALEVHMLVENYLKPIHEVKKYVKLRNNALDQIKIMDKSERKMLGTIVCPNCGNRMHFAYNDYSFLNSGKEFNAGAHCDNPNCKFGFIETI